MIEIKPADPRREDFRAMLKAGEDYGASLYAAESNHYLDVETLCQPEMNFFGLFVNGAAKGCGGFWTFDDYVEIKRVWIDTTMRGMKLGQLMMDVLHEEAKAKRYDLARLETGIYQPEALKLYEKLGYRTIAPFGHYRPDPLSVFMEKAL